MGGGAAIVGGGGWLSNEPDPSGPTFTIEPAPSAPSPDITSDTGIASSTDTARPPNLSPMQRSVFPSICRPFSTHPAALRRSRVPPVLPISQRRTSLGLSQIQLPVIRV